MKRLVLQYTKLRKQQKTGNSKNICICFNKGLQQFKNLKKENLFERNQLYNMSSERPKKRKFLIITNGNSLFWQGIATIQKPFEKKTKVWILAEIGVRNRTSFNNQIFLNRLYERLVWKDIKLRKEQKTDNCRNICIYFNNNSKTTIHF